MKFAVFAVLVTALGLVEMRRSYRANSSAMFAAGVITTFLGMVFSLVAALAWLRG